MGKCQQDTIIFQGMMGGPHHSVAVTASIADQNDGEPVQADIVTNLFERPGVDERRNTIKPGAKTDAQCGTY